jgi:hypothetical protein
VGVADAEVVHAAGPSEGDFSAAVEAEAERLAAGGGGVGLGSGLVGRGGGASVEGAVWPVGVVEVPEAVELGL